MALATDISLAPGATSQTLKGTGSSQTFALVNAFSNVSTQSGPLRRVANSVGTNFEKTLLVTHRVSRPEKWNERTRTEVRIVGTDRTATVSPPNGGGQSIQHTISVGFFVDRGTGAHARFTVAETEQIFGQLNKLTLDEFSRLLNGES